MFNFQRVRSFIEQHDMFGREDLVLVGVSGGSDSLGTLLILKDMGYNVHAISVNHGLRPEADEELNFVSGICRNHGIGFIPIKIQMDGSRNIQATARQKRYEAMLGLKIQLKARALAIGHTMDDQIETHVMALARGKGLHACGIQPVRADGVVRPMMKVNRQDIRKYLIHKGLTWVEDPSNQNTKYERVKSRAICRGIKGMDPKAFVHIDEHIDTIHDMHELVKERALQVFREATNTETSSLRLEVVNKERDCVQTEVLSMFLGSNPGRNVLIELKKLMKAGRGTLPLGSGMMVRFGNGVCTIHSKEELNRSLKVSGIQGC